MNIKNITFFYIILTLLISVCSAQVSLVKDNFLVSENKDQILLLNKKYFVIDTNDKKVALIKVVKLQNNKALCEIIKGKPQIGQLLVAVEEVPKKQMRWTQGLQLSYSQMTLSVDATLVDRATPTLVSF